MAEHDAKCPACGTELHIWVTPHVGGGVEENVGLGIGSRAAADASILARLEAQAEDAKAALIAHAKAVIGASEPAPVAAPAAPVGGGV